MPVFSIFLIWRRRTLLCGIWRVVKPRKTAVIYTLDEAALFKSENTTSGNIFANSQKAPLRYCW